MILPPPFVQPAKNVSLIRLFLPMLRRLPTAISMRQIALDHSLSHLILPDLIGGAYGNVALSR